jgi:hypothetical protein
MMPAPPKPEAAAVPPAVQGAPPAMPGADALSPTLPPRPAATMGDRFTALGKGIKHLMGSLAGETYSYKVNPETGQTEETPIPATPGQFFRNILLGALAGGAAASEAHSRQPGMGFGAGLAVGGQAGVQERQQQDLLKRQQAQDEFKQQLMAGKEQREKAESKSQIDLNAARIAEANGTTMSINYALSGTSRKEHKELVDMNNVIWEPMKTAGVKPATIDGRSMEDIPETEIPRLKSLDFSHKYMWLETGVKLSDTVDPTTNLPKYEFTYTAYDPTQKVDVKFMKPMVDALVKMGISNALPEIREALSKDRPLPLNEATRLLQTGRAQLLEGLTHQTAAQKVAKEEAETAYYVAHAKAVTKEANAAMIRAWRENKEYKKADDAEKAGSHLDALMQGVPFAKGEKPGPPLSMEEAWMKLSFNEREALRPGLIEKGKRLLDEFKIKRTGLNKLEGEELALGKTAAQVKSQFKAEEDEIGEINDSMVSLRRMMLGIEAKEKTLKITDAAKIVKAVEEYVPVLRTLENEAKVRELLKGGSPELVTTAVNRWKELHTPAPPAGPTIQSNSAETNMYRMAY